MSQGCSVGAAPPPLPGTGPAAMERPVQSLWHRAEQVMGLDLRSLALFRGGLAVMVIWDLVSRAPWLNVFYTEAGVLPIGEFYGAAGSRASEYYFTLHAASDKLWFQVLMFIVAGGAALGLLVGWRTKLMTVVSWLLILSLQNRHALVLNAGDSLMRLMMFWGMFMPLGARWSVDSALDQDAVVEPSKRNNKVWSIPILCFLVQLCLVYWCTAGLKSHPQWISEYTAVERALGLEYMIRPLGAWLATFPGWFLSCMTFTTLALEFGVPFLLWLPWRVGPIRTAAVIVMIGMHISFSLTLNIGLFSQFASVAWLAILPTWFWDKLFARARRNPKRSGATIWFDADCGFCQKMALLVRTFLLLPETTIRRSQEDPDVNALLTKQNTWAFEDASGQRSTHFDGVVAALRASPWAFWLAPVIGLFRRPGNAAYRWIATHRGLMGRLMAPAHYARRGLAPTRYRWVRDTVLLALLLLVILINGRIFYTKQSFPKDSVRLQVAEWCNDALRPASGATWPLKFAYSVRITQAWNMFAPRPPMSRGWFEVVGELKDGSSVELWDVIVRDLPPTDNDGQRPVCMADDYPNARWRKYMSYFSKPGRRRHRALFCKWLAREWKARYPDRLLRRVVVHYHKETFVLRGPATAKPRTLVWSYTVP